MSRIIVKSHPQTGLVITENTNNKDWGTVRLEQTTFIPSGHIVNKSTRVAFITGAKEVLEAMELKADGDYPIVGKLVVREQTKPFFQGQDPKLVPNTDVICKSEGQPIYRQTDFTSNMNEQDVLVLHDNGDEIKAAQTNVLAAKKKTVLGAN